MHVGNKRQTQLEGKISCRGEAVFNPYSANTGVESIKSNEFTND